MHILLHLYTEKGLPFISVRPTSSHFKRDNEAIQARALSGIHCFAGGENKKMIA